MPCNNCGKVGNLLEYLEYCYNDDCPKKYCSKCASKFLIECEDCEQCYCKEHFEKHECEYDGEDGDEDLVNYITYSLSKKKATILRHNLTARQEMELIEKLEDEGYTESARDEQVLLFSNQNKKEVKE